MCEKHIDTKIVRADDTDAIKEAAELIKKGALVAFPTETVYGLGVNALLGDRVREVYKAKGRPSDNPLIIHLSDPEDAERYCYVNDDFRRIAERFMPGPITVVLKKKDIIPFQVTGGLDTVALRIPENRIARMLISLSGVPIAAPSANLSGRPSTTSADHVISDMFGRIDMIIDGGDCDIGLESTIVALVGNRKLKLLRPGGITPEMLREAGFCVEFDKAVTEKLSEGEVPAAPGMKYRHYAPRSQVTLLDGDGSKRNEYLTRFKDDSSVAIVCFEEDKELANAKNSYVIGSMYDQKQQAHRLFALLRSFDDISDIKQIYAPLPDKSGIGLAIFNRMLKASGYTVITL
ncbi:MAG: threonylcarbamoyl-AMP synthase [Clostridia bacterium]|nr:threonylcarbamoyl-AMP synthase [Clostridia bacterium]MBQ9749067.1 threonylcarbamoyl-AMP synthase [Clostridia bacterium]